MNRAALALLVVCGSLGVAAGCVEKRPDDEVISKLGLFAESYCRCKDEACFAQVSEMIAAWSREHHPDRKPTEKVMVAMQRLGDQMVSCRSAATAPIDAGVGADLPAPATSEQATKLLGSARAWAARKYPTHHLEQTTISYVDAAGILDPDHGELAVQLGTPTKPVDDPKRRTGAPIKATSAPAPTSCPVLYWSRSAGWSSSPWTCRTLEPHVARCSPQQVWKRAIAKGAPADALAVMTLERAPDSAPVWRFKISDPPRKIDISESFPDDCELAVEAP